MQMVVCASLSFSLANKSIEPDKQTTGHRMSDFITSVLKNNFVLFIRLIDRLPAGRAAQKQDAKQRERERESVFPNLDKL